MFCITQIAIFKVKLKSSSISNVLEMKFGLFFSNFIHVFISFNTLWKENTVNKRPKMQKMQKGHTQTIKAACHSMNIAVLFNLSYELASQNKKDG